MRRNVVRKLVSRVGPVESAARAVAPVLRVLVLSAVNRLRRRRVVEPSSDAVVSLTSYGSRIRDVHLTIESIARGSERPARLVLWLADDDWPPSAAALRRLERRGLEVRRTDDLGPHKKYFPAVADGALLCGRTLVTADDDVFYPRHWLRDLMREARRTPETVVAYRAHEISVTGTSVDPYERWRPRSTAAPSPLAFPTGVSGVAYPPVMQDAMRRAGAGFLQVAPRADDVWLHAVALREGIPVRQAFDEPRYFPPLPGSQDVSLVEENVTAGGNDRQIRAVHGDALGELLAGVRPAPVPSSRAALPDDPRVTGGFRRAVARVPLVGRVGRRVQAWLRPRRFPGSAAYWTRRYESGGDSGPGSYSKFAQWKAAIINAFVADHAVRDVLELGCGDGNQLLLARYPRYVGYDISTDAVRRCRELFAGDPTKEFHLVRDHDGRSADLALSLDVVYHLVEDETFEDHMRTLFGSAERFVVVYSSNADAPAPAPHVRHRRFTDWVATNRPDWELVERVPNAFPYRGDSSEGSFADFYVFARSGG